MSEIQIPVTANATQAQQVLNQLTGQTKQLDQNVKKSEFNLFRLYVYASHLSALIARNIERGMRGTEASVQAMATLQGIQFVNSQIAAVSTALQAKAAFALPGGVGVINGIMLSATAIMMEQNAIQLYAQQQETRRLQTTMTNINRMMDTWD